MLQAPPTIHLTELSKTYVIPEREAGLKASLRSLVRRQWRRVEAVDRISFDIAPGEVVGFLGPNGAGKTTTLKMLSGLLHPTSGEVRVLGYVPQRRERAFLRQITLVMGNRNQLQWDLPALDSFELNRAIYRIPETNFKRMRDECIELLDVGDLVRKPVRNLSLGERMKMEIVGALLHQPQVLFLDEPTIGLDVTMQQRIRTFVAEYNRRYGATVLLTSHYMADVEALCRRVIVIHHGRLLFDGSLSELVGQFSAYKTIGVTLEDPSVDLAAYGEVTGREADRVLLRVPKAETSRITARLLADLPITDLTVEEPPIEDVITRVFAQERPEAGIPHGHGDPSDKTGAETECEPTPIST
jgi:ABC-2 type transport system ATP-binding protein